MLAETVQVLVDFLREFIPALKTEVILAGLASIAMGLCLWLVAVSSGLTGPLTYVALHPGTSMSGIFGGLGLIALTFIFPTRPEKF